MRTITLCAIVLLCIFLHCTAQDTEILSRTVFKVSPQHFANSSLKVGVERFNKNYSSSLAFFATGMMMHNDDYFFDGYNGLAGEVQVRKYFKPMKAVTSRNKTVSHQGVYGAAYLQGGSYSGHFKSLDYTTYDFSQNVNNWGLGFSIGYQRTLWQAVFVEAFVGGGIQLSDKWLSGPLPAPSFDHHRKGIDDPAYKGILPKAGLNIGLGL